MQRFSRSRLRQNILVTINLGTIVCLAVFAYPVLIQNETALSRFADRRFWILLHVWSGTVALILALVLLWRWTVHRDIGSMRPVKFAYFSSIAVSGVPGLYLATALKADLVYASGLTGLALAWILTTGLACWTLIRKQAARHTRWMMRSCIVTFAFVVFRGTVLVMSGFGIGTMDDRMHLASWACWLVPLCITEFLFRREKLFI